jgi:glucose-6-phosphate isomerase
MIKLNVDIQNALPFTEAKAFGRILHELARQHKILLEGSGRGNDFLGWVRLPASIPGDLLTRINEDAARIRESSELYVVIGIGGSYLGARAVIEALSPGFSCYSKGNGSPDVLFAGNNLCEDYHYNLLRLLDERSYSVAVISKSGTTTEPALAFRLIREHLEKKYGRKEAASRIMAVTDASRGALKSMADKEGYGTYVIPDDVGGRYSVLTPVGLLPVAVAGFDINEIVSGAREMQEHLFHAAPEENPAVTYAAIRHALYNEGKKTEIMVNYRPGLVFLSEWWKQLYGESEGKEGKGIFPASVTFTADLHSMGQYIQEGERTIFETVLSVVNPTHEVRVPPDGKDSDGLNYLAGKRLSEVNRKAEQGTLLAHVEGGVPNIRITVPEISGETLGQLIYFFEFACALSGYALGVNPFDQPGVEAYKSKMFTLLGKPGY